LDSKSINQKYENKSDDSRIHNIEISNFASNQSINDLKKTFNKFHIAKIELPNYNFMTGTHDGIAKTKIRLNKNQEKKFLEVLKQNNLFSKEYSD
jgi:D-mannonate dehydratase